VANAPGPQRGRKWAGKAAKANVARNERSLVVSCEETGRIHLPRISGVESKQAPWHVRLIYWFRKRKYGHVNTAALWVPLVIAVCGTLLLERQFAS